jgi:hypothetical protein
MKTPSHYILNLAILGQTIAPKENVAITLGALLPDIPIFIFYAIAKYIYKLPEAQIWTKAYYEPFWQNIIALSHSLPLAAIFAALFYYLDWKPGAIVCVSAILHSLLDFPVHHDDAHRHFFPFSNYRFISPLSYWDPNHYGRIVSLIEMVLVFAVNPLVLGLLNSYIAKAIIIAIDLLYLFGYLRGFF